MLPRKIDVANAHVVPVFVELLRRALRSGRGHGSRPRAERVHDPACIVVVGLVARDPTREVEDPLFHKCVRVSFGLQQGLRLQLSEDKLNKKRG